jgi:quinol monooxygenase YgiN
VLYCAAVTWEARPGTEQRLEEILREMAVHTHAEPGCVMYVAHRSVDRAGVYFLYEQFVDEAAFARHVESNYYKRLILNEALSLLEQRERVHYHSITSS